MSKRSHEEIEEDTENNKQIKSANDNIDINIEHLAVLLKSNGSIEEIRVSNASFDVVLGGESDFIGGWDENNVIIVARIDNSEELNKHKLQPPFHKKEIYGDIILIKTNEDNVRVDYTVDEFNKFQAQEIEEWELDENDDDDGDEDVNGEKEIINGNENAEDDDDDEDDMKFIKVISINIQNQLIQSFNRKLTFEELELINESISFISGELQSYDPEDEDADIDKVSKDINIKLLDNFSRNFNRKLSDDEETLIQVVLTNILSYYNDNSEEEDDHDDIHILRKGDYGIDDDHSKEFIDFLANKMKENFVKDNNREPSNEEMNDITDKATVIANEALVHGESDEVIEEGNEDDENDDVNDQDDEEDDYDENQNDDNEDEDN
eukprot:CAMPEP_0196764568 /NCGR_PEP_ID=MMETSP1095-20130614/6447_1 /TAXON_ID=96789 ORGANISM="Chromulina nebulosa, Strain UTEXLB2642" /NCGR_SAMPLE_ID=MMETSP1095 /ASSEMBLY_ACC=CAM_ASM_000446 /LENGTH=379 /DNA_ID=CAMNT_0042120535 /DNA_START=100 /DNA_END=1239 /DNA_ORIENTATION=-